MSQHPLCQDRCRLHLRQRGSSLGCTAALLSPTDASTPIARCFPTHALSLGLCAQVRLYLWRAIKAPQSNPIPGEGLQTICFWALSTCMMRARPPTHLSSACRARVGSAAGGQRCTVEERCGLGCGGLGRGKLTHQSVLLECTLQSKQPHDYFSPTLHGGAWRSV